MIITRENYKQAYLTFASNGTINLNRKTIGIWTVPKWGSRRMFTAKVHLNRNSMTLFSGNNKFQLMTEVKNNIPDSMLTRTSEVS